MAMNTQTEHDNKLSAAPIATIDVDTKKRPDSEDTKESEHGAPHRNGQEMGRMLANPTDGDVDIDGRVKGGDDRQRETKAMPKATVPRKQESAIDPETLIKFEDHQQKMREKKKQKAVMITVKIKSMEPQYPQFEVEIDLNVTVSDLKDKICQHSPDRIDPLRQRLIHRGRLMSRDGRTLKQCNVRQGDTVLLVRSRRNQTISSRNEGGAQRKDSGNRSRRNRAMTLGAPQAMIRRSTTPDPSQTAQVY